jgi:orotate phosphoribosyltransferase
MSAPENNETKLEVDGTGGSGATESARQRGVDVASLQVAIGAVAIDPSESFRFTSGLPSPIYCDNRVFLSHPPERNAMLDQLCSLITEVMGDDWDAVAGVATAGIPFAAWVAMRFDKPMVYIRSTEKEHGRQRRIEGGLESGKRVILVEDAITTGGSAISAVSALREEGLHCDFCFSIFEYGFAAASTRFQAEHITHRSLTNIEGLIGALRLGNSVTETEIEQIRKWHQRINAQTASAG